MRSPFCLAVLFIALLATIVGPVGAADSGVPDAAREEIIRRGNMVTHSVISSPDLTAAEDVIGMPADDSHKWFISVISIRGCQACEALKRDWRSSSYLQAWAKPGDQAGSWAHYNEYVHGDRTQDWRWSGIRIGAYPTILIQPPRNGQFGKPSTLVWQYSGYDGNPEALSARMADAVRAYITKVSHQRQSGQYIHTGHGQADSHVGQVGVDPPFPLTPITPNVTPSAPFVWPPTVTPSTPTVTPVLPNPLTILLHFFTSLVTGGGTTNLLLLALIGVQLWRAFRKATGQPLLLDDATFDRLKQIVSGLVQPAN